MKTTDFLDLAIKLWEQDRSVMPHEAKWLIGGPFSLKQIVDITGVNQKWLKNTYKDNERPGGKLDPRDLRDIKHARYQLDIGADIDKTVLYRLLMGGTSVRVLARLLGKKPGELERMMG